MSRAGATPVVIRAAADADLPAIAELYAHHVLTGTASFEVSAPTVDEMRRRRRDVLSHGLPYFVASLSDTALAGYAYATEYRSRVAYRHTVEDSVYVDPICVRRGAGRALLAAVIAACETLGYRQMVAVIGGSDNAASISLHAALGFRHAGVWPAVGRKFDRWIDTVLMQRALGQGASTPAP
ncbi:MAG TPA: GNAT family N-acetyltransferase [Casimicrobiaceae bacterium]|nr:GNAT family N-acetyltransferase [Casimicrobiaceae bacterium]